METWNINGHIVEFSEESHIYLVDGIIKDSVTKILKSKFDDYVDVSEYILKKASEKGTEMHKAIELYETTGKESDLPEFKNYLFVKKQIGFKNISNELPVIYEENGEVLFAGRLDQIYEIEGKLGINDFKRVFSPNKEKIAYQLNLYKMAYEQSYHKKIEMLSFTQLRDDKRKFVPLPTDEKKTMELLKNYFGGK